MARLAEWGALSRAGQREALASEREEASRCDDFLLSLFTPDRAANDLDRAPSVWRITLVTDGEERAQPVEVTAVRPDPTLRALYPTVGDFDSVYRVRFARRGRGLSARPFTLRMAGPKGRLDLAFEPAR